MTGNGKTKNLLKPKLESKLHNAFAILSQPNALAKNDTSNKKRAAINTAHTKRGTPSIGFAQWGHNTAYSLGSAFNRRLKKINKNKHVRFATSNKLHKYTYNDQPIMITYNSGADGHYISEKD